MIKSKSSLEIKAGERLYQFICESDSPLEEALQILNMMKDHTQKLLDDALKAAKEAEKGKSEQVEEVNECVLEEVEQEKEG